MIRGKLAYLNRLYSRFPIKTVYSERIEGSSPPSVFVGRIGYPKVYVGPMVPQTHGDTGFMDKPEAWTGKTAADIVSFRFQLVRGKQTTGVKDRSDFVLSMQEVALARNSVGIDMELKKKPKGSFLHEEIQPFGPSAPIKNVKIDSSRFDSRMEKAYYDTDLLARDAVVRLYENGALISAIQKAFSTGAFGIEKNRKLVPTRWSITAVDDMIGLHLLEKVKAYDTISEYRIYETENLNNKFVIIMLPTPWQYESMEAWFPQIIGDKLEIYSDFERYEKKKGYALIGGCYYSARLAIAEALEKEKKQAAAILLRESYPGYIPLGVFNVRENVRNALKTKPEKFESLHSALSHASSLLKIPISQWIRQSTLLKEIASGEKPI